MLFLNSVGQIHVEEDFWGISGGKSWIIFLFFDTGLVEFFESLEEKYFYSSKTDTDAKSGL